jgi:hypothetical protein
VLAHFAVKVSLHEVVLRRLKLNDLVSLRDIDVDE